MLIQKDDIIVELNIFFQNLCRIWRNYADGVWIMLTEVKSNKELRSTARDKLRGHWGKSILTVVIYFILTNAIENVISNDIFGWLLGALLLLIVGSWSAGILTYFIHLVRNEALSIKLLFSQLPRLIPFFMLFLLQTLFVFLWSLLLIVPGIIASIRYTLAYDGIPSYKPQQRNDAGSEVEIF
jgi:uncharacterized membrane protein